MEQLDIRRALKERGISQVELGRRIGICPQGVITALNGNPSISKVQKIAEAIGCRVTDLFYDDGMPAKLRDQGEEDSRLMTTKTQCPYCGKEIRLAMAIVR